MTDGFDQNRLGRFYKSPPTPSPSGPGRDRSPPCCCPAVPAASTASTTCRCSGPVLDDVSPPLFFWSVSKFHILITYFYCVFRIAFGGRSFGTSLRPRGAGMCWTTDIWHIVSICFCDTLSLFVYNIPSPSSVLFSYIGVSFAQWE